MNTPSGSRSPIVQRKRLLVIGGVVVAALVLAGGWATFYTDLLWFKELRFEKVFWTQIQTKTYLGLVFGAAFALFVLVNLWVVNKITNPQRLFSVSDEVLERYRATLRPHVRWIVLGTALMFGLFAGSGATAQWRSWLLFSHTEKFGQLDPVFHKDLGFFVFRLPFDRFVSTWAFSALIITTLAVAIAHYFMGGIRLVPRGDRVAPEVRAHLSVLLGLIAILKAWGYRLDQFNLLLSPRGTVTGASYTDVNAQLPALKLLVVISLVVAVLFLVNVRVRAWILPVAGIGLLALTSIFAGGVYPAVVQRLRVTPVERQKEQPYIKRNIDATRAAFGIDDKGVTVAPFAARDVLDRAAVTRNGSTIDNIRLWTPEVLAASYSQLQRIRPYYEFADVDVDRYQLEGQQRQVMLSAREITQRGLPEGAQTWVNSHLVYTHGFGVVASRVNRVVGEGEPDFLLKDIPPVESGADLKITEPRVYYGETEEVPFMVVRTSVKELDYPTADTFQETTYKGAGGVRLSNLVRRAAFAWRFRDVNLLISGALSADSRIMFRRQIQDRVGRVAPFLQFDGDPYVAIVDGRLVWIVDAYTMTDMYPYSQRVSLSDITGGSLRGVANYMRNSVKATIDAFDGSVHLYEWDSTDPIVRAWGRAFPGALTPRSEMSADLLAHVRYPEDLFKVQSERYTLYHMTEANDFYSKEDAWAIPADPTAPSAQARQLPPYYVQMKLPGGSGAEFALIRPFTPNQRQNIIAWMAASSDPADYGRLRAFVFPKQKLAFGPEQVQARINQDPAVSQQITLWGQVNSRVIYGNLLVIPIEDSLLYVQPLYLLGSGSQLPELKRVVVVAGQIVRMGETLEQALGAVFGTAPPAAVTPVGPGPSDLAGLVREAIDHYNAAQDALKRGDFATYGREIGLMKDALDKANARVSPSATPTPKSS